MTGSDREQRVEDSISRLAGLFDMGLLDASTNPAGFMNRVADEIERLRGQLESELAIRTRLLKRYRPWEVEDLEAKEAKEERDG